MARIEVQKSKQPSKPKDSIKDFWVTLCYYYPQYKYEEIQNLQTSLTKRMLKVARKEKAMEYMQLLEIATAPNSKKPQQSVDSLRDRLKEAIDG